MAYTGNGTSEQPYLIDNWEDFRALCALSQVYIAFNENAEHKVIDMNETTEKKGLSEDLIIAANIIGNGWGIRNLVTNGHRIICNGDSVQIEDLHFTNLISSSDTLFCGTFQFRRCSFSGVFLSHYCVFDYSYGTAEECTFNLHCLLRTADDTLFGNYHLNCCNIHLSGSMTGCALVMIGSVMNCRLTGNITLTGGILYLANPSNGGLDRYNVVTLTVDGLGTVSASSVYEKCIVNLDLIDESIVNLITGNNWHTLTTAQMCDADYLLNVVGFPCVAV